MVVLNEEGGGSLVCPTCRQATPIPASGVSGLQSAFHINHLLEIQESLRKNKDTEPVVREGASNITTPSNLPTVLSIPRKNWSFSVRRVGSWSALNVPLVVASITTMCVRR